MERQLFNVERILIGAQFSRFFSHFGMRTLLVLYLVGQLNYADAEAFSLNALFCCLVELGGILGGYVADRFWSLRKATLVGSLVLGVGYLSLALEGGLLLSMGLIITGGSLFSSNLTALVGLNYTENDPLRQRGFTRLYMMQNLGALAATLLCSALAMHYGFRLAFLVASSGMLFGSALLSLFYSRLGVLEEARDKRSKAPLLLLGALLGAALAGLFFSCQVLPFLPWVTGGLLLLFGLHLVKKGILSKEKGIQLFLYLGGLILFFAMEDQICSSLILFAQRQTDQSLFGWKISSAAIAALNPVVILGLGGWIARKQLQMITPFVLTATAFGVLALISLFCSSPSILFVMGCVAVISAAELMLAPMVLSRVSEMASREQSGLIMGLTSVGFSLAFQISGLLSKGISVQEGDVGAHVYGVGFALIAAIMLGAGCVLHVASNRSLSRKVEGVLSIKK